jgi:hypothetical protein
MPDLTQIPSAQPKTYGTPTGVQTPSTATDRPMAAPATPEQVKLAYQAYMRQVVTEAHAHFAQHVAGQHTPPSNTAASGERALTRPKEMRETQIADAGG